MEAHRPWPISHYIERGTRMAVDHPAVRTNPGYFMGLVPLEEVKADASKSDLLRGQHPVKIIGPRPAATLAGALKNNQAVFDATKKAK